MEKIKVVVNGAAGRMGLEIINNFCSHPDIDTVGAVELQASEEFYLPMPNGCKAIPFSSNLDYILKGCKPDVLVDFTTAKAVMPMVRTAAACGVNLVIGTTGLTRDDLSEIYRLAKEHKVGAVVAPNFAIGAVLMIHLAKIAARYFDYAEITELHHHLKIDAPSGTALATARAMAQARSNPFLSPSEQEKRAESRGGLTEGITIHSVRLPGLLAHQEVLLGGPGQTLSIRHDTINRECFMPGIAIAIKEVVKRQGLIHGLDALLGL